MSNPSAGLDDVVHQRVRLGILASLVEAEALDFAFMRTSLGLTAGNLSRHLQLLDGTGLVTIDKGYHERRPRTWVRITDTGRAALADEVSALKKIISGIEASEKAAARVRARRLEPRSAG